MIIKKLLVGTAAGALMLGAFAASAFAAPSVHTNFGSTLNAGTCNTNGSPVVNISFKVTNDNDSGTTGNNWANDNYNKSVQAWQQVDGSYCAIVKYQGQFVTYAGASPNAGEPGYTGDTVGAGVKGAFEGGYQATFNGTLSSGLQTKGNIGSFNFNCDPTTSVCPGQYDWVGAYFGPTADTTFNEAYWAWNYHAGNNGSWVNASTGNQGDITGN